MTVMSSDQLPTERTVNRRQITFTMDDQVTLIADAYGDPDHRPVLLSHGGGQTRHSWKTTSERIASLGWYVVAYDHRGHGESDWSKDGEYTVDRFAEDQRSVAGHFDEPPILVGASLGGLSCMICQGEAAEPVFSAVVFVDITPQMNHAAGIKIVEFMNSHLQQGFRSLEAAADAIAAYTGRNRRLNAAGLKKNLRLGDDGNWRWHWDPEFVKLRVDQRATTQRLISATQAIDVPMLLIRGLQSDIVTREVAEEFLRLVPQSQYTDIVDAHHMVVGDQNDIFLNEIEKFLVQLG